MFPKCTAYTFCYGMEHFDWSKHYGSIPHPTLSLEGPLVLELPVVSK